MLILYLSKIASKSNSKYLIGYLDEVIRPFVSIMLKMNGYLKAFKIKYKNTKLISFRIDEKKPL